MIMRNPLEVIRTEKNLKNHQMATIFDVSRATMNSYKNGEPKLLSDTMLSGVKKLGYNPKQTQKQYGEYRNALAVEILKEALR